MTKKQTTRTPGVIATGLKAAPSHVATQEEAEGLGLLDTNEQRQIDGLTFASFDADPSERLAQDAFAAGVRGDAVFVAPRDVHPQHHANRYAVTLNVGLVNNPWRHIHAEQRAHLYRTLLRTSFGSEGLRPMADTNLLLSVYKPICDTSRLAGITSTFVTEPTDVVTFDVYANEHLRGNALLQAVKRAVYWTAVSLNQEAIAAYYVDEGARDITNREETLVLSGREAHRWGAPRFDRFQKWDTQADHTPAKF